MRDQQRDTITWYPVAEYGNPECTMDYLVTTKTTGAVAIRRFDAYQHRWAFGTPLAWAFPPAPYGDGRNRQAAEPQIKGQITFLDDNREDN